jgi:hypothetical protein
VSSVIVKQSGVYLLGRFEFSLSDPTEQRGGNCDQKSDRKKITVPTFFGRPIAEN